MKKKMKWADKLGWQELALIGLVLFMAISHFAYVYISRQYPVWDENHYMTIAIGFYDLFHKSIFTIFHQTLTLSDYRQPLFGFILSLPLLLLGTEHAYKISLLTNGLYYLGSIVGVYFLAREYFSKSSSLLAAVIFAWSGKTLYYLHYTYSETAVTTWIVWATLFIVKAHFLTNRKYVILAGLMTALAVLTRWIAMPFLVCQIAVCFIGALYIFWKQSKQRNRIFINALLFISITGIVPIIIYYYPNFKAFSDYILRNRINEADWVTEYKFAEMVNTFSARSIMYYFNIISQNTIFLFIPFLIGVLVALRYVKKYLYPLIFFFGGYGFLTFIILWKEDRTIVPIYPSVAILSVVIFDHIKNRVIRTIAMIGVAVFAVVSFFGASWGVGPMGHQGLKDVVLPAFIHHPRRIYLTPHVWKPNPEYVNVYQVIQAIEQDKTFGQKAELVKLFTFEPVDNALNSILLYEKRNLVTLVTIPKEVDAMNADDYAVLEKADYMLTKGELLTDAMSLHMTLLKTIFVPIDGSTMYLYKRSE